MLARAIFAWLFVFFLSLDARAQQPAPLAETQASAQYTLGPGDQLRVIVYGETDLTGDFTVGANGMLPYPLIGEVQARGLTLQQLGDAIAERLRDGYVREPRVSVSVAQYRPFFILGEVEEPGSYPYSADLSVLSAVATAGGFTYRANRRRVFIRHAGESEERAYEISPETEIRPGDTIRIGERFF